MKSPRSLFELPLETRACVSTGELEWGPGQIRHPQQAADLACAFLAGVDREHVISILGEGEGIPLGIHLLSRGSTYEASFPQDLILRVPLMAGARWYCAVHNHPTYTPWMSPADWNASWLLALQGAILDLPLRDHLVIDPSCKAIASLRKLVAQEAPKGCMLMPAQLEDMERALELGAWPAKSWRSREPKVHRIQVLDARVRRRSHRMGKAAPEIGAPYQVLKAVEVAAVEHAAEISEAIASSGGYLFAILGDAHYKLLGILPAGPTGKSTKSIQDVLAHAVLSGARFIVMVECRGDDDASSLEELAPWWGGPAWYMGIPVYDWVSVNVKTGTWSSFGNTAPFPCGPEYSSYSTAADKIITEENLVPAWFDSRGWQRIPAQPTGARMAGGSPFIGTVEDPGATRYEAEVTGAHHGQVDGVVRAFEGGRDVGELIWSEFRGKVHIDWIVVSDRHRRRGIGRGLVGELLRYTGKARGDLEWGGTTPEGTELRRALS